MNFDYTRFSYSIEVASGFFALKSDCPNFDCWTFFESTSAKYCNLHNLKFSTNGQDRINIEGSTIFCRKNDTHELLSANISGWDIETNKVLRDIIYRTKKLFGLPVFSLMTNDDDFANFPYKFDVFFFTDDIFKRLSPISDEEKSDISGLVVSIDKFIDLIKKHEGESFIERIEVLSEAHKKLFIGHKQSCQRAGTVIMDTIELEVDPCDPLVIYITIAGDDLDILTRSGKGWPSYLFNEATVFVDSYSDGDGNHCYRFKYNNPTFRMAKLAPLMDQMDQNQDLASLLMLNFLSKSKNGGLF